MAFVRIQDVVPLEGYRRLTFMMLDQDFGLTGRACL